MTKLILTATAIAVLGFNTFVSANDWRTECGYNALTAELGSAVPNGAGIGVTHIEADESVAFGLQFLPDLTNVQFSGKTITDKIGGGYTSSHATTVAFYYYGSLTSMAKGISQVDCYEANKWMGVQALRYLDLYPPRIETRRVQNDSWISIDGVGYDPFTADILRRMDLLIDRDGVVVCAGVNNGQGSVMPKLACSAYNVIAVGLSNLNSSVGPTQIESTGRVKPDLVASSDSMYTSFATPVVASAAALLLQTADASGAVNYLNIRERRSSEALLAKALLMGGASKDSPITGWRRGFATPSTDGTVPLDYRYGAGNLNIYNSYHILVAGRQPASSNTLVATTGWDATTIDGAQNKYYFFDVPTGQVAQSLSILLAWNRKITAPPDLDRDDDVDKEDVALFEACVTGAAQGAIPPGCAEVDFDGDQDVDQSDFGAFQICLSGPGTPPSVDCRGGLNPVLANLDLRLWNVSPNTFTATSLRDQSISTLDNVEHIYLQNLPAGRYAISINADRDWPFAVAWQAKLAPG